MYLLDYSKTCGLTFAIFFSKP